MAQPTPITFVAESACRVQLTVAFEALVAGSGAGDFGSSDKYQLSIVESLPDTTPVATTAGAPKSVALARAKYGDLLTAEVAAGNTVVARMQLGSATTHTVTVWNLDMRVEIIKR